MMLYNRIPSVLPRFLHIRHVYLKTTRLYCFLRKTQIVSPCTVRAFSLQIPRFCNFHSEQNEEDIFGRILNPAKIVHRKEFESVLDHLRANGKCPSEQLAISVLAACTNRMVFVEPGQRNELFEKAWSVLVEDCNITPTIEMYNVVLKAKLANKKYVSAHDFLLSLQEKDLDASEVDPVLLIRHSSARGEVQDILDIIHHVHSEGKELPGLCYGCLIRGYIKNDDDAGVASVYKLLEESGIPLTKGVIGQKAIGYAEKGELNRVIETLHEWPKIARECSTFVDIYMAFIEGAFTTEAYSFLEQRMKSNWNFSRPVVQAGVNSLLARGYHEEAYFLHSSGPSEKPLIFVQSLIFAHQPPEVIAMYTRNVNWGVTNWLCGAPVDVKYQWQILDEMNKNSQVIYLEYDAVQAIKAKIKEQLCTKQDIYTFLQSAHAWDTVSNGSKELCKRMLVECLEEAGEQHEVLIAKSKSLGLLDSNPPIQEKKRTKRRDKNEAAWFTALNGKVKQKVKENIAAGATVEEIADLSLKQETELLLSRTYLALFCLEKCHMATCEELVARRFAAYKGFAIDLGKAIVASSENGGNVDDISRIVWKFIELSRTREKTVEKVLLGTSALPKDQHAILKKSLEDRLSSRIKQRDRTEKQERSEKLLQMIDRGDIEQFLAYVRKTPKHNLIVSDHIYHKFVKTVESDNFQAVKSLVDTLASKGQHGILQGIVNCPGVMIATKQLARSMLRVAYLNSDDLVRHIKTTGNVPEIVDLAFYRSLARNSPILFNAMENLLWKEGFNYPKAVTRLFCYYGLEGQLKQATDLGARYPPVHFSALFVRTKTQEKEHLHFFIDALRKSVLPEERKTKQIAVLYGGLIVLQCRKDDWKDALGYYNKAISEGVTITDIPYRDMIQLEALLIANGQEVPWEEGAILKSMNQQEIDFEDDESTDHEGSTPSRDPAMTSVDSGGS